MNKVLLLLSQVPADLKFAEEISKVAGLTLNHVTSPGNAAKVMNDSPPSTVLVDGSTPELHQSFETAIQETIGLFSDKIQPNSIHFLSNSEINQAPYLIHSPILGSFLTRDPQNPVEAGAHYGRIIRAFLQERAFGLNQFFQDKVKVQTLQLKHSSQKTDALDAVRTYLLAAKYQTRTASLIITALDELLMNAMYDAATDEFGKHIYEATPRSTPIALEGKGAVDLSIGFDGRYVGITVIDNFGSLDKGKMLAHISKAFEGTEYKLRSNVAGAGLGLSIIHQSGGSLIFTSESRARTEVTVFFRRVDSYKDFRKQFRFISTQFYF